jgi:excisionase family DNA binding protein
MQTPTDRPFLSVAELGVRLGVSTRTAYNLVEDGAVPVIKIRGIKRIPTAALERWLAEREQEALDSVRSGP